MSLATKLLTRYKQRIETLELEPSDGGCFELAAGDKQLYSKLETGTFPDEDHLTEEVGKHLGR